jgi:D-alanine-D-alanine ligase
MKKSVAIIYGGYSSEFEISKKSANTVYSNIDKNIFTPYLVGVTKNGWSVEVEGGNVSINRNDFTYTLNEKKIAFDVAFIMIHGTPGEDGKLQSYFDMIELPYVNSGVLPSSLSFNKWACNQFLNNFGVNVAKSVLLRKNDQVNVNEIGDYLSFPCFVKPNDGGSSFGISKVYELELLTNAINDAFAEGEEVIIESTLIGREVTCGMYNNGKEVIAFPVTEILTDSDFFDTEAKYSSATREITPADISTELTKEIQTVSKKIYQILGLKAMARVDFIIDSNNVVNVIEVNTIPGMTAESLVPQQIIAAGLKLETVLTEILKP